MFNISTKSDYGLILMMELAKDYGQDYISISDIAKKRKLSSAYLTQLTKPLIKSGLIESKEGKGGGYQLLKHPKKITVLEIIEAIEGPMNLVKCLKEGTQQCSCFVACNIKSVWPDIIKDIKKVLSKKALVDLI